MKAYLERAREHDEFMKAQKHEFEVGKRHLANMMGEAPELYENQEKLDVSLFILYIYLNHNLRLAVTDQCFILGSNTISVSFKPLRQTSQTHDETTRRNLPTTEGRRI